VLVKGSRFMKMERVVKSFVEKAAPRRHPGGRIARLGAALRKTMLLMLAKWIGHDIRLFNVFNYITLRAVLAALTALIISFIVGPWMIRKLTELKVGQPVRDDGPRPIW
jgi:hypothetical protein